MGQTKGRRLYTNFLRKELTAIKEREPNIAHQEAVRFVAQLWHTSSDNPNKDKSKKIENQKKKIIPKLTEFDDKTTEAQDMEIEEVEVDNRSETDNVVFKLVCKSEPNVESYEIFNNTKMVETTKTTDTIDHIEIKEVIKEKDEEDQIIEDVSKILRNHNMLPLKKFKFI